MTHLSEAYDCYREVFVLEGQYQVTYQDREVGNVQIVREGLYYKVSCVCQREEEQLYVLYAADDSNFVRLGILVPEGDTIRLTKKFSRKCFPGKINGMFLVANDHTDVNVCTPLIEGKPISQVENILNMKLRMTANGAELVTCGQIIPR